MTDGASFDVPPGEEGRLREDVRRLRSDEDA
jgi:hypothetical protein